MSLVGYDLGPLLFLEVFFTMFVTEQLLRIFIFTWNHWAYSGGMGAFENKVVVVV